MDDPQHKRAAGEVVFLRDLALLRLPRIDPFRQRFMLALLGGEIAQQLPGGGIAHQLGRMVVEVARLDFHLRRLGPRAFRPEVQAEQTRFAGIESLDVFAADERDVFAEPGAIKIDQPVPVPGLLPGHRLEQLGFTLTREELQQTYYRFVALADRKKNIYDQDLIGVVPDHIREKRREPVSELD